MKKNQANCRGSGEEAVKKTYASESGFSHFGNTVAIRDGILIAPTVLRARRITLTAQK